MAIGASRFWFFDSPKPDMVSSAGAAGGVCWNLKTDIVWAIKQKKPTKRCLWIRLIEDYRNDFMNGVFQI